MTTLHLLRTRIDRTALARFAAEAGVLDDDLGYALHLGLRRRFGPAAPQPFRLLDPEDSRPRLLGYSTDPAAVRDTPLPDPTAEWSLLSEIFSDPFETKPMPETWQAGLHLRFEIRARPVRRYGPRSRAAREHGAGERDAYQAAWDKAVEEHPDRETVYSDWLAERLSPAAQIETVKMTAFRRSRALRALPGKSGRGRGGRGIEGPDALFSGMLNVRDGDAFAELLARGVGRHAAFGYGMMLLRPGSA